MEGELGHVVRDAERDRPDVVLLEAGASRAAAARVLAQFAALPFTPGVILVTEDDLPWHGVATFTKWSSIEDVIAAVECAAAQRPVPRIVEAAQS